MGGIKDAAMWRDARLLDSQANIVLKHLWCFFKSKITTPFEKMYSLVKGYAKPRVKVFDYHAKGQKFTEIVHAQYQGIARKCAKTVEELIGEHTILPQNITKVFLVLGGDHG